MDIDTLLDLFAHMEWADARVWDTAMRSDAACVDETLCWLLLHPLSAQQAFLDAWSGQPVAFRTEYEGVRIADELEAVRAYYPRGRAFLESLTSEELATPMVLPWAQWAEQYIGRPPASTALGETIIRYWRTPSITGHKPTLGCARSGPNRRSSTTSRGCGWNARRPSGRRSRLCERSRMT